MNLKTHLSLILLILITLLPAFGEEPSNTDYMSTLTGYNELYNSKQFQALLDTESTGENPVLECYLYYMKGKSNEALMLPEAALKNYEKLITLEAALEQKTQLLTLLSSLSLFKLYLFSERRDQAILTLADLLLMRGNISEILEGGEKIYGIKAPSRNTVEQRIDRLCAPYLQLINWQNQPCTIVTIPLDNLKGYKLDRYRSKKPLHSAQKATLHSHWGNTIILFYQGYFRSMANASFKTMEEARMAADKIVGDLDGVTYVIKNIHTECFMIQFGAFRNISRAYEKNRYIEDTLPQ